MCVVNLSTPPPPTGVAPALFTRSPHRRWVQTLGNWCARWSFGMSGRHPMWS